MGESESSTPVKARWAMLRKAILEKKVHKNELLHSVRSFSSFELFSCKQCTCLNKPENLVSKKEECLWFSYTCKDIFRSKSIWIQHPSVKTNLEDLTSFDNTGNVCIWPAEEVLAYYCTLHSNNFTGKSVIELGGGNSCLAGFCVALNASLPKKILLTDGNSKCVKSIESNIEMNSNELKDIDISSSVLRWDDIASYQQYNGQFDYVLCADCLFFDNSRENLANAIYALMKPEGIGLIFSPRRGNTLSQFVDACEEKFSCVTECDNYCLRVSNCHKRELKRNKLYQTDLHFPILIELVK